jgi:hypothetical protein
MVSKFGDLKAPYWELKIVSEIVRDRYDLPKNRQNRRGITLLEVDGGYEDELLLLHQKSKDVILGKKIELKQFKVVKVLPYTGIYLPANLTRIWEVQYDTVTWPKGAIKLIDIVEEK